MKIHIEIDYGFATGRHWIRIGDKVIAQSGDDCYIPDDCVKDIIDKVIKPIMERQTL